MEEIIFYLLGSVELKRIERKNIIILILQDWDDWFEFSTLYSVIYYNNSGERQRLGYVKIGEKDMKSKQRRPNIPSVFKQLTEDFFSLGQDVSYYENLNEISDEFRENILLSMNDLAYSNVLYRRSLKEKVTRISLMRDVSKVSIEGQFRRLAQGNSLLTEYDFDFICPKNNKSTFPRNVLNFAVIPKSNPPTNIHVIIGRNGVGKTHLFNNMINSLINTDTNKYGFFKENGEVKSDFFANLISVSFSAFEETQPIEEIKDKTKRINYSNIGLKKISKTDNRFIFKSPTILKNEFVRSIEKCIITGKKQRWLRAVAVLETDPVFNDNEISKIVKFDEDVKDIASTTFSNLSSGHKIILLTITRLVETIEEKSLVILDEPETYLHPPLLSAFIRSISDLLIQRNAVAIIGTHSPVVLQEIPKSCVWKLRRNGMNSVAERLRMESFGENVGTLTQEVFGLEVTDSGFHNILNDIATESDTYQEALSSLNNQLGFEGKAILRNLISEEDEED